MARLPRVNVSSLVRAHELGHVSVRLVVPMGGLRVYLTFCRAAACGRSEPGRIAAPARDEGICSATKPRSATVGIELALRSAVPTSTIVSSERRDPGRAVAVFWRPAPAEWRRTHLVAVVGWSTRPAPADQSGTQRAVHVGYPLE